MPQLTLGDLMDWLMEHLITQPLDTTVWLELPAVRPQLDTVTRQRLTATARDCLRHGACLCEGVRALRTAGYLGQGPTLVPVQTFRVQGPEGAVVMSGEGTPHPPRHAPHISLSDARQRAVHVLAETEHSLREERRAEARWFAADWEEEEH